MSSYEVDALDNNIDKYLNELNSSDDKIISSNIQYATNLNTYSKMYGSLLQAVIDYFQVIKNPFSDTLWKIKAGYNKLLSCYMNKVKEMDYGNEINTLKSDVNDIKDFMGNRKSTLSSLHDALDNLSYNKVSKKSQKFIK